MAEEHLITGLDHRRTSRAPARSADPQASSPYSAMLRLQSGAGNAAVSRLVANGPVVSRLRSEDDGAGAAGGGAADASSAAGPIEAEADERAPTTQVVPAPEGGGSADAGPVGDQEAVQALSLQLHRIPTDVVGPPPASEGHVRDEDLLEKPQVQREGPTIQRTEFPTYATITGNGTISSETSTAWTETKAATSDGSRREQGFWIRWNKDDSTMSAANKTTAPTVGNATTASVDLGGKPADTATNFTVGSFHTHTPTTFRSVGRPIGPSTADGNADRHDNVAGVVYDYTSPDASGNIPAHHPLNSAARLWSSGPDKRT